MYKKLGNYNNSNNYSNYITINAPIIRAKKNENPSCIFDTYNNPNGDDKVSCDSFMTGKGKQLQPNESIYYYSDTDTKSIMKCTVDQNNIGSIKCYNAMSDESKPQQCCPTFSKNDDFPIILGAGNSEYERVHDALQNSDPKSVTAKNVDIPQCVNLNQKTPPSPPPCCGIKDSKGKCNVTGHWVKNQCSCNTGYTGICCETGARVPDSELTSLIPSQIDHILNEPEGSGLFSACDYLFVKPWGGVTLSNPKIHRGYIVDLKKNQHVRPDGGYLFLQSAGYGPNVSITATSPTGTETINIDQTFCSSFFGTGSNITTSGGSNVKSRGGDGKSYSGVVVIGPKIN